MFARLFWFLPNLVMLWWGLITDREVPRLAKVLAILGVIYFLSPADLLPEWIAYFGILDDLAVLYLSYRNLVKSAPKEVVERYVSMMSGRGR